MSQTALTIRGDGTLNVLKSKVLIFEAEEEEPKTIEVDGIWDTGACSSVISERVAQKIGLKPINSATVHTANGEMTTNIYIVNLTLPSRVKIQGVQVTEGKLGPDIDMLIGMDIITLGDFAITNKGGRTVMSFRYPSSIEIDYVREINGLGLNRTQRRELENKQKKLEKKRKKIAQ